MLPDDSKEAAAIKRKTHRFYYNAITRTLYRRSYDGILLRCLLHKETQEAQVRYVRGSLTRPKSTPKAWLLLAKDL